MVDAEIESRLHSSPEESVYAKFQKIYPDTYNISDALVYKPKVEQTAMLIHPNETLTWTWDQRLDDGSLLKPGHYQAMLRGLDVLSVWDRQFFMFYQSSSLLGCKNYQRLRASPNSAYTATLRSTKIRQSRTSYVHNPLYEMHIFQNRNLSVTISKGFTFNFIRLPSICSPLLISLSSYSSRFTTLTSVGSLKNVISASVSSPAAS